MKLGYARVSSIGQDFKIQKDRLKSIGCRLVFAEKMTGTKRQGREELQKALSLLADGDVLVVTKIDRLARSLRDLQNIMHDLEKVGASLKALDQAIDTSTASGKAFLGMLGVFAEFETNIRKERQLEGIAKAKAEGKYKGRKPTARAKLPEIKRLLSEGVKKSDIAKKTGISRASVYRILKEVA